MNLIIDILQYIPAKLLQLFYLTVDWFLGLNLAEKIVIFNAITAFFAVVLPSAKYFIFNNWFTVNNPMSVYMIGVAFYMFISIFMRGKVKLITRLLLICIFVISSIYLQFGDPFVKCKHVLLFGYYMNYIAAIIHFIASFLSYSIEER